MLDAGSYRLRALRDIRHLLGAFAIGFFLQVPAGRYRLVRKLGRGGRRQAAGVNLQSYFRLLLSPQNP